MQKPAACPELLLYQRGVEVGTGTRGSRRRRGRRDLLYSLEGFPGLAGITPFTNRIPQYCPPPSEARPRPTPGTSARPALPWRPFRRPAGLLPSVRGRKRLTASAAAADSRFPTQFSVPRGICAVRLGAGRESHTDETHVWLAGSAG